MTDVMPVTCSFRCRRVDHAKRSDRNPAVEARFKHATEGARPRRVSSSVSRWHPMHPCIAVSQARSSPIDAHNDAVQA